MPTTSERDWLTVRSYLTEHRYDLAVAAAQDYPPDRRVAGTPLLSAPGWLPPAPVPLRDSSADPGDVLASCMQRRLLGRYAVEPTCEAPDGDERWL